MKKEEIEMEEIKIKAKLLFQIIFERYRTLTLISTLLVALMALLFAVDKELIKNVGLFKISLIFLILLIPISLIAFLMSLQGDEDRLRKKLGINFKPESKRFWELLLLYSPFIITGLLTIGIILFILSLNL